MRMTPRVAGFKSEDPAGLRLECMAGFVGIRMLGRISSKLMYCIALRHALLATQLLDDASG